MHACVFALDESQTDPLGVAEQRFRALVEYFAPLGARRRWSALIGERGGGPVLGWIAFDAETAKALEQQWGENGLVWWGEAPPEALRSAAALQTATSQQLRSLSGSTAIFCRSSDGLVVTTGVSPPATLYRASQRETTVLATHAAAASWLALGTVGMNTEALARLVAFDFVGGGDTLLVDVERLPVATQIRIARRPREQSYWDPSDRWELLPPDQAQGRAEAALFRTLSDRLAGHRAARLGLTGGLDSLVVAVALCELGLPFETFTWDHDGAAVEMARAVAARLGVRHRAVPTRWAAWNDRIDRLDQHVRSAEGVGQSTGLADLGWPDRMSAFVTGGGGEIGRAFYYRGLAANYSVPTVDQVMSVWKPWHRLRPAPEALRLRVKEESRRWLERGASTGLTGWSLLDYLYAEERLMDWGRAMLAAPVPTIAAFTHPEVASALASLPLAQRTTDGFHRAFLERFAPDLVPPPTSRQRRGVPRLARRVAGRIRALRPPAPVVQAALRPAEADHRRWLLQEVLAAPLIRDVFGRRWAEHTQTTLRGGDPRAVAAAIHTSGALALAASLEDLQRPH